MPRVLFALISIQIYFLETSGSESCYSCYGTPQCGDPIDYNEVSPRDCLEDSICLKYISSSKNRHGDVVADELTYRKCFQPIVPDMDICAFIKDAEENALRQLNHTLVWFECYVCHDTNCNIAHPNHLSYLTWISQFLIILGSFLSSR